MVESMWLSTRTTRLCTRECWPVEGIQMREHPADFNLLIPTRLIHLKSRSRSRSVQRYGDSDLAKPLTSAHAIDLIKQV